MEAEATGKKKGFGLKHVKRVLFVCTGNICRSPMAEGVLISLIRKKGVQGVTASSAGTHGLVGRGAERYAVKVCAINGIDISGHVARRLDKAMIEESDLIVVMENEHRERVLDLCPEAEEKTSNLAEFVEKTSRKRGFVADPYGLPEWAYEACFDKIERSVSALMETLLEKKKK